jgi:putative membrane protein
VLDWLREFNVSDDYATINGQPADVIGFVYKEPDYPDEHFMVARFTVSCCVADASAIAMPVQYSGAGELEQGTWVRVSGIVEAQEFQGDTAPVIYQATVDAVDTPEHPYLYP